ncbi:MAG TPA: tRNA preQ1(34) S-adenosylmethionine ribosyltransferase-isomerase QueA [Polyangiaceae bacterium]|nr:tRNA preQ1(34) S-adenosylmethionine ribosyltransferase-isomerase QueA [Polyangiaceae bacterium]
MRADLLDFDLPPDRIASRPPEERDGARLLVLDREGGGAIEHRAVRDLDALLPAGALVVVNDTRVLPARLFGKKPGTGGKVEIMLVQRMELPGAAASTGTGTGTATGATTGTGATERWRAMGRSSKPLREGMEITFDDEGKLKARIEGREEGSGLLYVTLSSPAGLSVSEALEALGHVPLPPYIRRADEPSDRARYQTVFAREPGAVAAPTAGLHLSEALIERLKQRGIEIAAVTLHVGLGTFQPVTAEDLDQHRMHAEVYAVPASTADAIDRARTRGAPVVAIGTTVVRALESAAHPDERGRVIPRAGETRLLIQPGYAFRVVDGLVTNFHLPRSTLLALVFALAGRDRVLAAYSAAIEAGYRFYSYGDAMLIRPASWAPSRTESG